MPRYRRNDPTAVLTPLVERFISRLAGTVERFTVTRVERAVKDEARSLRQGRGRGRGRLGRGGRRAKVLCYYPGCKNIAAPRFGMFCAALHKTLPKAEKAKYRALRLKEKKQVRQLPPKRAAKRGRRRGRKK